MCVRAHRNNQSKGSEAINNKEEGRTRRKLEGKRYRAQMQEVGPDRQDTSSSGQN